MFEKNMKYSYLLDVYGSLLDDHSAAIMRAYYEDDLSLSEIADGEDISRQGVRHIIKKSEEQLDHLDERLGLSQHYTEISELRDKLYGIASRLESGESCDIIREIREIADRLEDK
ncbi:MAG: DNA-binding protein [Ruminococcaceae bacterium]|nr:DNA-binding protein [Oscillospiraceae bacterium]